MSFRVLVSTIACALVSTNVFAQHAGDVEFGYDNLSNPTAFVIEASDFTTEGILFFESEMEELDPFDTGNFSSDEPGFTTNPGEGLLVNSNDEIFLNALDASTISNYGVGYVNYYNPTTDALELFGGIRIEDNSAGTNDLLLNGGSIVSGDNPGFIGRDGDGDVHDHLYCVRV